MWKSKNSYYFGMLAFQALNFWFSFQASHGFAIFIRIFIAIALLALLFNLYLDGQIEKLDEAIKQNRVNGK